MTRLILIASLAVLALLLLRRRRDDRIPARWVEPEDGVQPWDLRSINLIDPKQRGAL